MKDTVASYDTLANLFERVQFFLKRLNCYTGIPITTEMTELLGKIMAQVVLILGLSVKLMRERRISESIHLAYPFVADLWLRNIFEETGGSDGR